MPVHKGIPHYSTTSLTHHSQSTSTGEASGETERHHSEETLRPPENENGPIEKVWPHTKNARSQVHKQPTCPTTPQQLSPTKKHNSPSSRFTTTVHTNYQPRSYYCYEISPRHQSSRWKNCSHKCYISTTLPNH